VVLIFDCIGGPGKAVGDELAQSERRGRGNKGIVPMGQSCEAVDIKDGGHYVDSTCFTKNVLGLSHFRCHKADKLSLRKRLRRALQKGHGGIQVR
jgi:hypothetical protein